VGPFLLFSYYLNGIDLPTILIVLALGGAWVVFLTVLGVCAATLADGRLGRAFVHFVVLGTLGMGVMQGLGGAFAIAEGGSRLMREEAFPYVIGVALWLMFGYGWLLFETAASRLALITEDYSRGPRKALALQMVVSAGVVTVIWLVQDMERMVAGVAGVAGAIHLTLVGVFLISDLDGQARALRSGTRPWSLLRPGAVRGFRLMVLLLLGWALFCVALQLLSVDTRETWRSMLYVTISAAAYPILYFAAALLVGKLPDSDRLASPVAVRVLFVSLVGLACVLSPLVAMLADKSVDDGFINLLNPILGMVNFGSHEYDVNAPKMSEWRLAFICVVALVAAFAADRALVERERRIHAS